MTAAILIVFVGSAVMCVVALFVVRVGKKSQLHLSRGVKVQQPSATSCHAVTDGSAAAVATAAAPAATTAVATAALLRQTLVRLVQVNPTQRDCEPQEILSTCALKNTAPKRTTCIIKYILHIKHCVRFLQIQNSPSVWCHTPGWLDGRG